MSAAWSRPVALVLLRRSEHVLFAVLLLVGVIGAEAGPRRWLLAGGAVGLAGWYAAGVVLARRSRARRWAAGWLVVLTAGWAGLVAASVSFVWLAFPLFLLYTQMLPLVLSVPAVVVVTAGAVTAIALDRGRLDSATVVGPLVGATVAVVITVVYRDLAEQVRQRAALIDQLTATRDRLAASERRAGVLSERERLAREIHDTVTQSLTSIVLVLRTARDTDPTLAAALRAQLDTAIAAARTALTDTRRLVRDLTPAELAGRSLPDALSRIVADQPGLVARLHVEGEPVPVPTPAAVAVLRGAQEALANVRAHARARRVEVTLTFLPDTLSLDVVDDGVGFDPLLPMGPSTGTGLGLTGLRARAAEVGGSVEIDSAPRRGTALNLTVPRREPTDD
ncbi:sensor histidine kinase [Micromonospora sp. CPCC 205711]|uniref:sensor histidine kinase n=1 Tax=Micromonospora sp. CPCC 205547 TaxID=3122400 RepID=UPI002FF182E9